jgi:hypothetical protein
MQRQGKFKVVVTASLFVFVSIVPAQETHNLEIIWQKTGDTTFLSYGFLPTTSGDVNGDGYCDILYYGNERSWAGRAFLFYGGNNLDTIPDAVFSNSNGYDAICMGDFNGDNFDDVALGSQNGPDGYGRVYIYLGGNPIDTICDFQIRGPQGGSLFGQAISAGDVNGDSYSDLVVGAYGAAPRPGAFGMGQVYIYFGSQNFDTIPDVILDGGHQGQYEGFGTTVGSGADVNRDNCADLIVGAPDFGSGGEGRVYIYYGGNPMDTIADVTMIGEYANQNLGLAGLGLIINRFDYAYAVFGDPFWPPGVYLGPGKVYILFGGNPMDSIPDVWMIGRTDTSCLGTWTASAGNLNLDNYDEIISGAPWEGYLKGAAYVWLSGMFLDTTPDAWIKGVQYDDDIGRRVTSAGDVNSDSIDEIMVSNYASNFTPKRVWVCKYTGPGIEERPTQGAICLPLEVKPNPARSVVRIRYPSSVQEIRIYDISGKIVKVLDVDKIPKSGQYEIRWDLRDDNQKKVATGVYFIEVKAEDKVSEIKKITVVK